MSIAVGFFGEFFFFYPLIYFVFAPHKFFSFYYFCFTDQMESVLVFLRNNPFMSLPILNIIFFKGLINP